MDDDQPAVRIAEHNGDAVIEVAAGDEAGCLRGVVRGLAALAGASTAKPTGERSAGAPATEGSTASAPAAEPRVVRADGDAPAERMVALADALIAIIDVEGLVATDAVVAVAGDHAAVRCDLASLDPAAVAAPPKAATWHEAACGPEEDGRWHARVIIDR